MNHNFLKFFAGISLALTTAAQAATVSNPIIWADVPDPSVIRDGDKYYMVCTMMHNAPGVPVMMSEDLANWRTVNYAYQILDNSDAMNLNAGKHAYGKGSWASSLRKHKDKYYILTPSYTTGKTHLYSTDDIENGTWDEVRLPFYHDPSLFFDDDDRAYIIFGSGEFKMVELNADLKGVKNNGQTINLNMPIDQTTGTNGYIVKCEGAHMEKINGEYYLFAISWPNGKCRTELCFRSKSLTGNYSGKIVLQENGVAQGGIFDTPEGKWYAMLFRDSGGVGRIPWLIPVTWQDGWPMMGNTAARTVELPNAANPGYNMVTSDDFDKKELALEWEWNHNPDNSKWSLTERDGYLRITTGRVDNTINFAKNTLTQRSFGPKCSGRVAIDVEGMKVGDRAGLSAFADSLGYVAVEKTWGGYEFVMGKTVNKLATKPFSGKTAYLRVDMDFTNQRDKANFYCSSDGEKWEKIGVEIPMPYTLGMFAGFKFALFNWATREAGGYADFDWFKVGEDEYDEIYLDAVKEPEPVAPYLGAPAKIPGIVEVENYDFGGKNVSFYDADRQNHGGEYRKDGVDIYASDEEDGYAIGYCEKGEWMNYTVNVEEEGEYNVIVRGSKDSGEGHISLTIGEQTIPVTIDSTGSWDVYADNKAEKKFNLAAGEQVLKLSIDESWVNVDRIIFKKYNPTSIKVIEVEILSGTYDIFNSLGQKLGAVEIKEAMSIESVKELVKNISTTSGVYILKSEDKSIKIVM